MAAAVGEAHCSGVDRVGVGERAEAGSSRATLGRKDNHCLAERWHKVREGTWERQKGTGMARAMAGWVRVVASSLGGRRRPWSGTCQSATAGTRAERRGAVAG